MENQKYRIVSLPITIISLVVLIAAGVYLALCVRQANNTDSTTGTLTYQSVKIKQLINNINQYDGQKVVVSGTYVGAVSALSSCTPPASNGTPEILDTYAVYPSLWMITDQDSEIGAKVLDANGKLLTALPEYKAGQKIQVKAIARATTVESPCNKNISNKSIYLEIKSSDINLAGSLEDDTVGKVDTSIKEFSDETSGINFRYPSAWTTSISRQDARAGSAGRKVVTTVTLTTASDDKFTLTVPAPEIGYEGYDFKAPVKVTANDGKIFDRRIGTKSAENTTGKNNFYYAWTAGETVDTAVLVGGSNIMSQTLLIDQLDAIVRSITIAE